MPLRSLPCPVINHTILSKYKMRFPLYLMDVDHAKRNDCSVNCSIRKRFSIRTSTHRACSTMKLIFAYSARVWRVHVCMMMTANQCTISPFGNANIWNRLLGKTSRTHPQKCWETEKASGSQPELQRSQRWVDLKTLGHPRDYLPDHGWHMCCDSFCNLNRFSRWFKPQPATRFG